MKKVQLAIFIILTLCFQSVEIEAQTDVVGDDMNYSSFGEQIDAEGAKKVMEIISVLQDTSAMGAKITGVVNEVCQVKGCWMTVSDQDGKANADPLFVKFKDYGFFVPKDISGKEVIMEGKAYREVTSVEELRHYAKDAGKSDADISAITEPKEELRFLAHGVLVKN